MLGRSHGGTREITNRLPGGGSKPRRAQLVVVIAAASMLLPTAPAQAAVVPGGVAAWGGNEFGQLGNGSTSAHLTAAPVQSAPGMDLSGVTELGGGRNFVIALKSNGTVTSWGVNDSGQLGDGTMMNSTRPVGVLFPTTPPTPPIVAISAGHYSSLAVDSAGTAWAWGRNNNGQLGDNTTQKRSRPVKVGGTANPLTSVVQVAGGRDHSLALRSDGSVWAWGSNAFGQLGDGTTTRRTLPVPVQVTGGDNLTGVVQISAGREHSLAVLSTGAVVAWGSNVYGQVGDGTKVNRTRAVPVTGLTTGVADVEAGAHHSLALKSAGTVVAWGRNYRGEIGDTTTAATRLTPTAVTGLTNVTVTSIAAGRDHNLAVLSNGTMRSWGFNASGQLGDNTTTTRRTAVAVVDVTGAQLAEGGEDYSVALVP